MLAGSWSLTTPESTDLTQMTLTFDENGVMTSVQYKIGDTATVTATAPTSSSDVNGSDVVIASTFNGNSLTFNGTLNGAASVINGRMTTLISSGSLVISIDNGPATLTRQ